MLNITSLSCKPQGIVNIALILILLSSHFAFAQHISHHQNSRELGADLITTTNRSHDFTRRYVPCHRAGQWTGTAIILWGLYARPHQSIIETCSPSYCSCLGWKVRPSVRHNTTPIHCLSKHHRPSLPQIPQGHLIIGEIWWSLCLCLLFLGTSLFKSWGCIISWIPLWLSPVRHKEIEPLSCICRCAFANTRHWLSSCMHTYIQDRSMPMDKWKDWQH